MARAVRATQAAHDRLSGVPRRAQGDWVLRGQVPEVVPNHTPKRPQQDRSNKVRTLENFLGRLFELQRQRQSGELEARLQNNIRTHWPIEIPQCEDYAPVLAVVKRVIALE